MLQRIFSVAFLTSLGASSVRMATPILLAALGEIYNERAGVLNLGLEGVMLMGALGGFFGSYFTENLLFALLFAMIFGGVFNLLMGFLCITLKSNQIIAGIAMSIFGSGLTHYLYRIIIGTPRFPPQVKTMPRYLIYGLSDIPILGSVFFSHPPLVYIAFILVIVTWVVLEKTTFGLNIKAVGEKPEAVDSKGLNVSLIRYMTLFIGGLYAGLGGAYLSISLMDVFQGGMTAGRGYIAIAVVIFARWNPKRALLVALFFGLLQGLGMRMQALDIGISHQFFQALPYFMTIIVLVSVSRDAEFPSAFTMPFIRGE